MEAAKIYEISKEKDWRNPILEYIKQGIIPNDKIKENVARQKAASYVVLDGRLY